MKVYNKEVVLLSTADWDNPFWTNKQHVAVEFARRGYKVFYIDSLGLRKPSLNKKDFSRILKKLLKAIRPPKKVQENIWVWSPVTLPWNEYRVVRSFNKFYLSFFIKLWNKLLGFKKPWLWTYNPLTTEFLTLGDFSKTVYHCVDEIKAQPGMPIDVLEREEKTLIKKADIIFVTALQLKETRIKWNDNIHYFSNVADFAHFNKAVTNHYVIPTDLKDIRTPILGFIGAVSSYKINLDLISYLASQRPEYSIVIIGEVGEGDPSTRIDILHKHPNIHLLGPKSYSVLPQYLKYFDVALLPNNLNEYTNNMFPMKFFEYLAAGKSIVSVDLSSIKEFNQVVKIGKDNSEFVMAVDAVIAGDITPLNERLALAKEYTYETRTEKMLKVIFDN